MTVACLRIVTPLEFTLVSSGVANAYLGGGTVLASVHLAGIGSRPAAPFSALRTMTPLATLVSAVMEMMTTLQGII